ncbi:MAG: M3 family metallopeptidase [Bacteroides sp.]|nr:M3 family metallopeptidase [Bacteroides sp.]MCM1413683.1 M3 family metallopeptidase [Bacteroides sp.]MCM1471862.1 M3 family metallopeptidase [Bacteroides sp.]
MKKTIMAAIAAIALLPTTHAPNIMAAERTNPFLTPYDTPFEIPPFDQIKYEDYMPAFERGVEEYKADINAIVVNRATPDFDNTILAMEQAGKLLNRVMLVFSSLDETESSDEMVAISEKAYPLYSQTMDEVMMNPLLFQKVKYVYDNRDKMGLTAPQLRDVEETYKQFVRSGALLSDADKDRLKAINTQLTDLYLKFNKNLLNATNAYQLVVDDASQLAGLPASSIAVAADEAKARGMEGKWVFTLHAPSRLPLLQYADNRDLRRKMYEAYTSLASSGQYDNRPVINEILKARTAKASLLDYPDFASYMTANVMAKNPANAEGLLMQIWEPAVNRVKEEVAEMQALADREGADLTIEPWDYYYYAEKVRRDKYALDEDEVRAYFSLDNVREGIFNMAQRLYGVTFTELPDAPKYNPEVKVYEVKDSAGNHVAVFMTDYFPRASKRQGAWMSEFQGAFVDPDGTSQRPIVYNVGNFSKPTADTPSLLTLDEVETMFHEFGHGLHGMLTRAELRSQAGTNVDRDFVELPSQIHEHWALEPELLKTYARHYKTGEVIPDSLIEKLAAASTHNQGFITTELVGAALLDLKYGALEVTEDIDISAFEEGVAKQLGMPREVQFRYRSPYFRHIFGSDGYASGYYTYLWAQVLDCDGFELFKEKGIFDPETARSFRENVLEKGGSEDPMELYVKFRGHEPNVDALLRFRGLTPVKKQPEQPKLKTRGKH